MKCPRGLTGAAYIKMLNTYYGEEYCREIKDDEPQRR
jgi:hypothetical protein